MGDSMAEPPTDYELLYFLGATGKFKHFCPDWDYMAIDETCPEFDACTCTLVVVTPANGGV